MSYNIDGVTVTERGWAGHFCSARYCLFRRNTLLEYANRKWVVSTVGKCIDPFDEKLNNGKPHKIGFNRFYETMAFKAKFISPYWEADVEEEIIFDSPSEIAICETGTDIDADNMHNTVVDELIQKIKTI